MELNASFLLPLFGRFTEWITRWNASRHQRMQRRQETSPIQTVRETKTMASCLIDIPGTWRTYPNTGVQGFWLWANIFTHISNDSSNTCRIRKISKEST